MLGQLGNKKNKEVSSPSRTYVAVCNKSNFDGYYMRKFTLPEFDHRHEGRLENDINTASWYFLNRIDFVACIEGVMTFEDYSDISAAEQ